MIAGTQSNGRTDHGGSTVTARGALGWLERPPWGTLREQQFCRLPVVDDERAGRVFHQCELKLRGIRITPLLLLLYFAPVICQKESENEFRSMTAGSAVGLTAPSLITRALSSRAPQ